MLKSKLLKLSLVAGVLATIAPSVSRADEVSYLRILKCSLVKEKGKIGPKLIEVYTQTEPSAADAESGQLPALLTVDFGRVNLGDGGNHEVKSAFPAKLGTLDEKTAVITGNEGSALTYDISDENAKSVKAAYKSSNGSASYTCSGAY